MHFRHRTLVVTALALLSLLAPVARAETNIERAEQQLFDAINEYRTSKGLPKLKRDAHLAAAARKHAGLLASRGELSHQLPMEASLTGRAHQAGARYRSLAENVAQGRGVRMICDMWIQSEHHRANLLDSDMDSLGVGIAERGEYLFAVADLSEALQ